MSCVTFCELLCACADSGREASPATATRHKESWTRVDDRRERGDWRGDLCEEVSDDCDDDDNDDDEALACVLQDAIMERDISKEGGRYARLSSSLS